MAPLSNYISFLFLITLLFPLQIITARESQFFSKVTSNFNKNKETELVGNKEGPAVTNKPEQPEFIPETENSYGLYGHDSHDHLPSTNTPNYPTYTTPISATYQPHAHKSPEFEEDTSKYFNNNDDVFSTNKDAFGNDQLSDTKYTQEEYNSIGNQNNHQKNHFNNNAAATQRYNYHNSNNAYSRYNGEKQGMSDTRFLEGGRYFHDIYNDQKYNPTLYGDSSTEMNTNNKYWYNNRGNNNNYAYQNYGGNNNNNNNQEEFEDEQEEFEP